MISAIPGQRSSAHVWGKEIVERENVGLDEREKLQFQGDRFLMKEAVRQRDPSKSHWKTAHLPKYHAQQRSASFMIGIIRSVSTQENLLWAKRYRHWTVGQVWWITICPPLPKSILCLASSKATVSPQHLQGTLKHQKKIMVCGCFSWNKVGAFHQIKGILRKERYHQILISATITFICL